MAACLSDEQWRNILDLANAAVNYPKSERIAFLEADQSRCNPPGTDSDRGLRAARVLNGSSWHQSCASITEHLGHGGMGDVYAARDLELERIVALKFLNPESLGLEGAGERFIREARTASALNHPNIVTIHEVLRSDTTVAIVMEL